MSDVSQMLARFLGDDKPEAEEADYNPKKAAFKRFVESLQGDDLDEQMAAYDDYQLFLEDEEDDGNGEIEDSVKSDS
jgi:hypothetical protein